MENISLELRAKLALEKNGFAYKHTLGQNFIFDENLLLKLLDLTGVGPDDNVLEIGPGTGLFTCMISGRCSRVVSLELDKKLEPVIAEMLKGRTNAEIIWCDAMKADIDAIVNDRFMNGDYIVIANLPYYITTDMIVKLITLKRRPAEICVMVQEEAAQRLMSLPGEKQWCASAAVCAYYGSVEKLVDVGRDCFTPSPHVDSAFIRISVDDKAPRADDDRMMLRTINCAFLMRRKKLTNNLKSYFGLDAATAEEVLETAGIDLNARGEALSIGQLIKLSNVLGKI